MNLARVAALFRALADEIESESATPAPRPPAKAKTRRKAVRAPYVPKREFSEIEIARARVRAKKLGIPV